MFELHQAPWYLWPVSGHMLTTDGTKRSFEFDAHFARLPQERIEELFGGQPGKSAPPGYSVVITQDLLGAPQDLEGCRAQLVLPNTIEIDLEPEATITSLVTQLSERGIIVESIRPKASKIQDLAVAREVLVGWGKVQLNGEPVEFTPQLRDQLLSLHPVTPVLINAFVKSLSDGLGKISRPRRPG